MLKRYGRRCLQRHVLAIPVKCGRNIGEVQLTNIGQALDGKNVKDMLLNVGSGGGAAAAPAAGGAAGGAAGSDEPADAAKEEKKEEEKEESDEDMGFGLFD